MANLRRNSGLTMVELLVALIISMLLMAGLYRTLMNQHKTYTVQEEIVEMQQSVRLSMNRMVREIRMAGFGNVADILPVNGSNQIFTMNPGNITVVGAFEEIKNGNGTPVTVSSVNGTKVTLSNATGAFDTAHNKYISIGGLESHEITNIAGNVLTLKTRPKNFPGAHVFRVGAVTYSVAVKSSGPVLQRDEHRGGAAEDLGDGIESIGFEYLNEDGNITADRALVRMIRVTAQARTGMADPQYNSGDGYRRRTISSNVRIRNIGLTS